MDVLHAAEQHAQISCPGSSIALSVVFDSIVACAAERANVI
jgi:hypothetical protein